MADSKLISTTATSAVQHINRNELKFVKQLGEGTFSSVFQMTWLSPSLGPIEIAAKRLNKRDVHELEIMSGLEHPNVVRLLGVVDEEIDFMLILELCDRGSLRSYLKELHGKHGRGLPDPQFHHWMEQAAIPLKYLKEQQIIHKDIKSPNYMITAENTLKLGDFGIAKITAETITNATDTASYPWMAPELLTDFILSPKYDIFAYGVVMVVVWEMRTGKLPFEGMEPFAIAWRVCQEGQRLPIPEDCPKPIKDLMKRCWETDWKKRPDISEVLSIVRTTAVQSAASMTSTATTIEHALSPDESNTKYMTRQMTHVAAPYQGTTQKQILDGPWMLEKVFDHRRGPGKVADAQGIAIP